MTTSHAAPSVSRRHRPMLLLRLSLCPDPSVRRARASSLVSRSPVFPRLHRVESTLPVSPFGLVSHAGWRFPTP